MKLQNLSLVFFKNHTRFQWKGDADVVAIAGLNGMGKTNILDAIHFLCLGKSYFSATDVQCIQNEEPQAGIIAQLVLDSTVDLKVKFKRGGRKKIEKNGVPYKRVLEYIGQYIAVVIAPGDIELVYGANEKRRSFINQILGQVDREYLQDLVVYNKLMEQRNRHLKQDEIDHALLNTFDDQIAPLAHRIFEKRTTFMSDFTQMFSEQYFLLSGEKEKVELNYTSGLQQADYLTLAAQSRHKDIAVQRSFVGVHKDELDVFLGEFLLKKYGSQGQIKSALIALKLAEYSYLKKTTGKSPFLLLDDIFEKIDEERAQVLTQIIKNDNFGQIFITDTSADRLTQFCEEIGKPYNTITLS